MDIWKFYDVTHRDHVLCNPMSYEKHEQLIRILQLRPGARVLEIAVGKAEFLVRLAEKYGVTGTGVDISQFFIAEARKKLETRVPGADLELIQMNGADFKPEKPESYDLAACIGASWIFKGHKGTLEFLKNMVVPGGLIVDGEPYWRKEPSEEYLKMSNQARDQYGTYHGNVVMAENMGLTLLYIMASNLDDWDVYEGMQWNAANRFALEHPDDPDLKELQGKSEQSRTEYLRWGRDCLGWAIYVFRKSAAADDKTR